MKNILMAILLGVLITGCSNQESVVQPESINKSIENPEPWLAWSIAQPDWVAPADPFTVIGNIHYVGTKGLGSYLITTDAGHILIDGVMPQSVREVVSNIEQLGFDIKDVKILLNSHAHFDHSGGLAELKRLSGARMVAHKGDVSALEGGFYLGFEDQASLFAPPVEVDRQIVDNDTVEIDGVVLTAKLTPGHTRGCTSWTMTVVHDGPPYDVVFFCSATVAGNRLVPEQYEGIVDDYRKTFQTTRSWRPDIPLAFHDSFFDLWEKRAVQRAGDPFAFVDRESFPKLLQRQEKSFEKNLAEQQAAANSE